jgi:hypothetical protein
MNGFNLRHQILALLFPRGNTSDALPRTRAATIWIEAPLFWSYAKELKFRKDG